jgi:hypothetical protein
VPALIELAAQHDVHPQLETIPVGNLRHRAWDCDTTSDLRSEWAPSLLRDHPPNALIPAVAYGRGLFPVLESTSGSTAPPDAESSDAARTEERLPT